MQKTSMAWKFGIFGMFLIVVSIVSEVIYLTKQGEFSKIVIYPRMLIAKKMASRGNLVEAWQQVQKAAEFHERYILLTRYSFIPQEIVVIPFQIVSKAKFESIFSGLMESASVEIMITTEEANLSLLHYRLGLGMGLEYADTEWLLKKAVALAPELSFYHVELANYYWLNGRVEEAKQVLVDCERFYYPAEHCREFAVEIGTAMPYTFGFMSDEVEGYYERFIRVKRS